MLRTAAQPVWVVDPDGLIRFANPAALALVLSSVQAFRVLGPALGFSVLATLLAALTLVPAAAVLLRRGLFWLRSRQLDRADVRESTRTERFVAGKPVAAAVASSVILIALSVPALGFKPDYNVDSTISGSPSGEGVRRPELRLPAGRARAGQDDHPP